MVTWLADVLRAAGQQVREEPGWKTRGHGSLAGLTGIVWHHTASATTPANDVRVIRDGRADLPGPLAQLYLARDGTWTTVAAGRAWHAGSGAWPGLPTNNANAYTVGIEAAQRGTGAEPWAPAQLAALRAGTVALVRHAGLSPSLVIGHKEWTARKIDPWGLSMPQERARIAAALTEPEPGEPDVDYDKVRQIVRQEVRAELRERNYYGSTLAHRLRVLGVQVLAIRRAVEADPEPVDLDDEDVQAITDELVATLGADLAAAVADELAGRLTD